MNVRVIVNRAGGTGEDHNEKAMAAIHRAFNSEGVNADVRLQTPETMTAAFAEAADAGLDAVVAAGGDGTVSAAAGRLSGCACPLGILPLGTLNHLARDAGIPTNMEAAARVIARAATKRIDVAEVNDRVFVNNSAVGLYPDMVRFRDEQQARQGRTRRTAMLTASLATLRHFRRRRLWISAPGFETPVRTPLLFVGNNRYRVSLFALGRRDSLDEGMLCLYAVKARSRRHLFAAGIRGLLGKLDQQRDFVTAFIPELEILSDRPRLTLSLDGETLTLETPLRYRIRPGALNLIVPAM